MTESKRKMGMREQGRVRKNRDESKTDAVEREIRR